MILLICKLFVCVGYFKFSCQVVRTTSTFKGSVTGITMLNDRMYVSHNDQPQVAVYNLATFQFQQFFDCYSTFFGNQQGVFRRGRESILQHLVACDVNNCLYISFSARDSGHICKVTINRNKMMSFWSLGGSPQSLSVTSLHNLLVTMSDACSLLEYSTDGRLIRQIDLLDAGITNPVFAVQFSNDQFAVTHHGRRGHCSIVSSDGQLVRMYRGDAGDMNQPQGIAVGKRGRIFVADRNNNRILMINSMTLSADPLPLPTGFDLNGPHSVHFDVASNRLYIGEWNGRRIICCQL